MRASTFAAIALCASLAGCKKEPPDRTLTSIPSDAALVAGVDLEAIASWPFLEAHPQRVAQMRELTGRCEADDDCVTKTCGLELGRGRASFATDAQAETAMIAIAVPGIGRPGTLACLADKMPILAPYDADVASAGGRIVIETQGDAHGIAPDDDLLVLATGRWASELDQRFEANASSVLDGDLAADVRSASKDAAVWIVGALPSEVELPAWDDDAAPERIEASVRLHEGLALTTKVTMADADAATALRTWVDEQLDTWAPRIYMTPGVRERIDVNAQGSTVAIETDLDGSALASLDFRWTADTPDSEPIAEPIPEPPIAVPDFEPIPEPVPEPVPEDESELPKIGIAPCDEYLTKMKRCMEEQMPASTRDSVLDALQQSADAWKKAADAGGPEVLEEACRSALDAAKEATTSMGCTW